MPGPDVRFDVGGSPLNGCFVELRLCADPVEPAVAGVEGAALPFLRHATPAPAATALKRSAARQTRRC